LLDDVPCVVQANPEAATPAFGIERITSRRRVRIKVCKLVEKIVLLVFAQLVQLQRLQSTQGQRCAPAATGEKAEFV
jgi:hypothetical protein